MELNIEIGERSIKCDVLYFTPSHQNCMATEHLLEASYCPMVCTLKKDTVEYENGMGLQLVQEQLFHIKTVLNIIFGAGKMPQPVKTRFITKTSKTITRHLPYRAGRIEKRTVRTTPTQ